MSHIELCNYCDQETTHLPPDGISYCGECDQIVEGQTHGEVEKHPGVQDAMHEVGLDTLDECSTVDAFRLGFLAGRLFEAKEAINKLSNNIFTQDQAE